MCSFDATVGIVLYGVSRGEIASLSFISGLLPVLGCCSRSDAAAQALVGSSARGVGIWIHITTHFWGCETVSATVGFCLFLRAMSACGASVNARLLRCQRSAYCYDVKRAC
jgi:hypothetical protein